MGSVFLLLPLSILAGYIAGSLTSRRTRRELEELKTTVSALQKPAAPAAPASVSVPVPVAPVTEDVTPEILMVLSAAVAAFLGKKVRVRSARMLRPLGANAWAQQGRVFVQASHSLPRPR